ncbi:DUF411 domain-containing protein [Pseudomonas sp. R1-18]|uniref:DUF411 domain-containing protein n=1 Tax=Pseudomonas sp. R1-18 TaxID=1632772 RepID=UPI003DA9532B
MRRLTLGVLGGLLLSGAAHAADLLKIDVHRDANCGCCKQWVKHLQASGFEVNDQVETDMSPIKAKLGVPASLRSCHTAVIDGKFVEGHVPAEQIRQLHGRQDLIGVAVPGMPLGSPGMEHGETRQPYRVLGLTRSGAEEVLAEY